MRESYVCTDLKFIINRVVSAAWHAFSIRGKIWNKSGRDSSGVCHSLGDSPEVWPSTRPRVVLSSDCVAHTFPRAKKHSCWCDDNKSLLERLELESMPFSTLWWLPKSLSKDDPLAERKVPLIILPFGPRCTWSKYVINVLQSGLNVKLKSKRHEFHGNSCNVCHISRQWEKNIFKGINLYFLIINQMDGSLSTGLVPSIGVFLLCGVLVHLLCRAALVISLIFPFFNFYRWRKRWVVDIRLIKTYHFHSLQHWSKTNCIPLNIWSKFLKGNSESFLIVPRS